MSQAYSSEQIHRLAEVIARPHVNVDLVLPLGRKAEVEKEIGSHGGKK